MPKYFDPDGQPDADARSGIGVNATGEIVPLEAGISARDTRNMHREAELAEQISEERAKRSEPIHMEGLRPMPQELRQGLPGPGMIPGGPGALDLAPSMRRTIPPPYKRDRIAIDHHGKTWGYARASTVEPGDIVVDFGKIVQVASVVKYKDVGDIGRGLLLNQRYEFTGDKVAVGTEVLLVNIAEETRPFDPDEQLRVFRVHDS